MTLLYVLIGINLLLNIGTIAILIVWPYRGRFEWSVQRTFWLKIPYALYLYLWNPSHTTGRAVLRMRWRNPEKIPDSLELKRAKGGES